MTSTRTAQIVGSRVGVAAAAFAVAAVLVSGGSPGTQQAFAATAGCFETVDQQQFRYEQDVPATDDILEFRYEQTYQEGTKLYEVKNLIDWSYAPPWTYTPSVNGQVPFALIQAAGFNPQSLGLQPNVLYDNLPGGTYGTPNDSNPNKPGNQPFSYIFTYTDVKPVGWPSSGWDSFTSYTDVTVYWPVDGSYTTDPAPDGYTLRDSRVKTKGTDASKKYYVEDGTPDGSSTDDQDKASWVLTDPDGPGPWTQFDERTKQVTQSVPCHVTPAVLTATPGDCDTFGTVNADDTDEYKWEHDGPMNAVVYTAVPIGDVILDGQLVYGPFNLEKQTVDCIEVTATGSFTQMQCIAFMYVGQNTMTLSATPGTTWSYTIGSVKTTLQDGEGYNGPPPSGSGSYLIESADSKSDDAYLATAFQPLTWNFPDKKDINCTLAATGDNPMPYIVGASALVATGLTLFGLHYGWFAMLAGWVRRRFGVARTN